MTQISSTWQAAFVKSAVTVCELECVAVPRGHLARPHVGLALLCHRRLLRDLGLATQHPPDAFLVKAVTPHELHSIVTMRICGGCGARAGRAGDVAAELERQLLLPGSALCQGAVTRSVSGILVLGQQAMGTGGDNGEGSEGSEASGVRGGVELSHRRG